MTSRFANTKDLRPREIADYGFARTRDIAFDAVRLLWRRRSQEGMKQIDLADKIGRDPGWVSKKLRGPGNWTLRTLGELVEGLNGELEIIVHPLEVAPSRRTNYSVYEDGPALHNYSTSGGVIGSTQIIGAPQATGLVDPKDEND